MRSHTDIKRPAVPAMFAALSLGIYALEALIPNPIPIPGIKLGLANIVVLIVLRRYGFRQASLVLAVRLLLSALLFGSLLSLMYSAVGGLLCICGEALVNRFLHGRAIFLSAVTGALLHNAGQLAVALIITRSSGVLLYAPYLSVAAVITGFLTGLCAHFVLLKLPSIEKAADSGNDC